jgi:(2R)-sulfolactate sulfo-lyase subunit alpha
MKFGILMHETNDDVGVAVMDLPAGSQAGAATLEGQAVGEILVAQDIPLGHKIAMRDLALDQPVIEYGRAIGQATQAIAHGDHVHIHNLRSMRW